MTLVSGEVAAVSLVAPVVLAVRAVAVLGASAAARSAVAAPAVRGENEETEIGFLVAPSLLYEGWGCSFLTAVNIFSK